MRALGGGARADSATSLGMTGCAGASGGITAFELAAQEQRLDTLGVLTNAGVVDPGSALADASGWIRPRTVAAVRYLLQQKQGHTIGYRAYVNACSRAGVPTLFCGIMAYSPRVVQLLVEEGATTATATSGGGVVLNDTPLSFTTRMHAAGEGYRWNSHRRRPSAPPGSHPPLTFAGGSSSCTLLVVAERSPSIVRGEEGSQEPNRASIPLALMLPTLRRRNRRRGMLLAAMLRWVAACGFGLQFIVAYCGSIWLRKCCITERAVGVAGLLSFIPYFYMFFLYSWSEEVQLVDVVVFCATCCLSRLP